MLTSLAQRVNQTQLQEKDPDAANLLGHELGANPDALYILAQTVLVQDIALQQAKAQVTALQQQVQQAQQQPPAHATSFLGGLFGRHDSELPAQPPQMPTAQPAAAPPYQPVPQYAPPQAQYVAPPPPPPYGQPAYVQPQYGAPQYVAAPMGQPSFLRGAMQTAAGVAAGALAFEGVESILHGFGGHGYGGGMGGFGGGGFGMGSMGGFGGGFGGGGFERPVEETTVVNNYYDAPGSGAQAGMGGEERGFAGGNEPHFHESADQSGAQFSNASYETAGNDQTVADDSAAYDSSADNVQVDDGGSGFDDGGGGSDGGGGDSM